MLHDLDCHLERFATLAGTPNLNSLILTLTHKNLPLRVLIDSGASDCFIDQSFVAQHSLPTRQLRSPMSLRLFDGSTGASGLITHCTDLHLRDQMDHPIHATFLLTTLDPSCDAVLGLDWLTTANPIIDWGHRTLRWSPLASTAIMNDGTLSDGSDSSYRPESPAYPRTNIVDAPESTTIPSDGNLPDDSEVPRNPDSLSSPNPSPTSLRGSEATVPFTPSILSPSGIPDLSDDEEETPAPDLRKMVPEEYHEFLDVFDKTSAIKLPEHRPFDHAIEFEEGKTPGVGPIYSLSEPEQKALKQFLDEHLANGTIRPSQAPCGSPVLFVKKKDGSLRMCVDYRKVNSISTKDRYPLPRIQDLIDRLGQCSVFTKIDLRNAYHLLRIRKGDEWKTTFRTRYGAFQFLVMPFGLCNAPSSFQRFMNSIFADVLDHFVVIYLDDILIFSRNPAEHAKHVREVLRRLRMHRLYAKAEKCEFHRPKVDFVGFVVGDHGVSMEGGKASAVQEWPEPRNVRDI